MSQADIRIQVTPEYLPEQSDPDEQHFLFAYHITISNLSSETVQLLSRHWVITNGRGETEEVRGDGVVGEQPTLAPGESFQYSSGCPLATEVGTMHGEYTLQKKSSGEFFEVKIPIFRLAMPGALH